MTDMLPPQRGTPGWVGAGGLQRLLVDARGLGDRPLDALRLLLVADVARRVAENLLGLAVLLAVVEEGPRPTSARLAIREADVRASSPAEARSLLGGEVDALLAATRSAPGSTAVSAVRTIHVAQVAARARGDGTRFAPDRVLADRDPLAVRLALLHAPYAAPAVLSLARLHRAEETLQRWRVKVAGWRDLPPEPAPAGVLTAMRETLVADLDTEAVLRQLHRVETDLHLSSGSKFEAFTRADRVLGLDLRHLVGKIPR